MGLPPWGLYDKDDKLVAAIRAINAYEARDAFRRAGMQGARVKAIR